MTLEFIPLPPTSAKPITSIDFSNILRVGRTIRTQSANNTVADTIYAVARLAVVCGGAAIAFMLTQHGIRAGSTEVIKSALELIGTLSKS